MPHPGSRKRELLHEPVERLFPLWRIMRVIRDVPEVGDFERLHLGVELLTDMKKAVAFATR